MFALEYPYPNPFNPSVSLDYRLPERSAVKLVIFNVLGQRVAAFDLGRRERGSMILDWNGRAADGTPLAAGVYFFRVRSGEHVRSCRAVLVN